MIETILTFVLVLAGIVEGDPLDCIAAGIFAVAVNIAQLGDAVRGREENETEEH